MSILGIDLAKASYQVTLLVAEQTHRRSFQNDAAAFADLIHDQIDRHPDLKANQALLT